MGEASLEPSERGTWNAASVMNVRRRTEAMPRGAWVGGALVGAGLGVLTWVFGVPPQAAIAVGLIAALGFGYATFAHAAG